MSNSARLVCVLAVACGRPAHRTAPPPPSPDAAVDAELVEYEPPHTSEPNWGAIGRIGVDFDWDKYRARIEAARKEREGKQRPPPCAAKECHPLRTPLAARGQLVETSSAQKRAVAVELDIGSDDGVTDDHWAAFIDERGKPLTRYGRVHAIQGSRARVVLELDELPSSARLAVIVDPPQRLRLPER